MKKRPNSSGFKPPRAVGSTDTHQVVAKKTKIEKSTPAKNNPEPKLPIKNVASTPVMTPKMTINEVSARPLVVWKVFQTKRSSKKHKSYDDGYLVIRDLNLTLKDEEGTML